MAHGSDEGARIPEARETAKNPTHPSDTWPPVGGEIARSLTGIDYPVTRADLKEHAQRQGASKDVLERIEGLEERVYQSLGDAAAAIDEATRKTS